MFGMRGKKPPQPAAGDGDADERDDAKDREPAKEAAPEKEKGKGKPRSPTIPMTRPRIRPTQNRRHPSRATRRANSA